MPLVNCPDCSREISPRATHCVGCGCPQSAFPVLEVGSASKVEPEAEAAVELEEQASAQGNSDAPEEVVPGFYRCQSCRKLYLPSPNRGDLRACEKCGGKQPSGPGGSKYRAGRSHGDIQNLIEATREQGAAAKRGAIPFQFIWKWARLGVHGQDRWYWRPSEKTDGVGLSEDLWLRYSHPATGRSRVVPIQGKTDWLGLLPWLWHLVRWTPARLWVWGVWGVLDFMCFSLFADELFEELRSIT